MLLIRIPKVDQSYMQISSSLFCNINMNTLWRRFTNKFSETNLIGYLGVQMPDPEGGVPWEDKSKCAGNERRISKVSAWSLSRIMWVMQFLMVVTSQFNRLKFIMKIFLNNYVQIYL
ncbi:uncharacterized protein LOC125857044 isoform X1 [Solanum stenotomum]|uniref:uncharacterized protein LOC125857044 isoform X1 n=1 Tax=Solanum stenotomum TaxID=172797 RepID=UPI0020D055EF|nr:uncharacterized protein LOC125857044 isoform X1 [Solanum stenotomum]XP_049392673.1 uncharacterized protein LOC125857044 isoform X1 [Solanum stenotomum]